MRLPGQPHFKGEIPAFFSAGKVLFVEGRIERIVVFGIKSVRSDSESFAEALKMDNFSCSEEFYHITHIRVVGKPKNIVIGSSCLLLCCIRVRTTLKQGDKPGLPQQTLIRNSSESQRGHPLYRVFVSPQRYGLSVSLRYPC